MKIKDIINVILSGLFIAVFSFWCFFIETPDYSESERRVLAKEPEITGENILSGEFASDFESYATDRFPLRDFFRSVKAYTRTTVFMQQENNGIFVKDGHISKIEYPMNTNMADYAVKLFTKVNDRYLKDNKVYFAMVPDKNKDLADLKIDYNSFEKYFIDSLSFATPIEISSLLTKEDYYFTDTHWRQDKIVDVAKALANGMGTDISGQYTENVLEYPFYGVYSGQSALNVEPDTITYLTNDTINGFTVTGAKAVYDMDKAQSRDPYEFFLSGNQPVVTVTNPENTSGKRLVIFRDSFASSIAPLLAEGYSETVLVDLRYISSDFLEQFVSFENADVLFLYSTVLLNNSLAMK